MKVIGLRYIFSEAVSVYFARILLFVKFRDTLLFLLFCNVSGTCFVNLYKTKVDSVRRLAKQLPTLIL